MKGSGRLLVGLVAIALVGCGGDPPRMEMEDVTRDNPVLPMDSGVVRIVSGGDTLRVSVEIAETDEQKSTGLMERDSLGADEGMLFLYDEDRAATDPFYMFRTRIPLDIAFMDSTGRIVAILQMEPCTSTDARACERYAPGAGYRSALEMNLGYFEGEGVEVGDRVELVTRYEVPE